MFRPIGGGFPVNSTSVETPRIARVIRVMKRRRIVTRHVTSAGVFNCRFTAGTKEFSAHAFGDAVDFMSEDVPTLRKVADRAVKDATRKTWANRFKPTKTVFVIVEDRQWIRGKGWSHYDGDPHTGHVHAGCSFSTFTKPPCAA